MKEETTFEIRQEKRGSECIVHLSGKLDLSKAAELRSAVDPLLARTNDTLRLNLRHLDYIDSTGIGLIVTMLKARDERQAPFYVDEIPAKIKRLFDITGLTGHLQRSETSS